MSQMAVRAGERDIDSSDPSNAKATGGGSDKLAAAGDQRGSLWQEVVHVTGDTFYGEQRCRMAIYAGRIDHICLIDLGLFNARIRLAGEKDQLIPRAERQGLRSLPHTGIRAMAFD